ncbi:hypothetical protein TNCV_3846961 [Trichonephila clavipes]|nr:hypothetical protein TNCV_3846961 [Trichonephila clavipes]
MAQNRSDECTGSLGHCLLFDLGEASTPRLAVIIVRGETAPIDNRRSLSKKNTVASADVERMGLRNKGGVMKKMSRCFTRILATLHSPLVGSVFVCSAQIGHE